MIRSERTMENMTEQNILLCGTEEDNPSRSKLILLGGTSGTGKTLLAERLARHLGFACFSLDYAMMGLYRGFPETGITPTDGDTTIAEKMWGFTEGLLVAMLENGRSAVVEGIQLPPVQIAGLCQRFPDRLFSFFLVFSNRYMVQQGDMIARFRNVAERRLDMTIPDSETRSAENRSMEAICLESGLPCLVIDDDFNREQDRLTMVILESIGINGVVL